MSPDENFATAGEVVRRHALQLFEAQRDFMNGSASMLARVHSLVELLQSEGLSLDVVAHIVRGASRSFPAFPFPLVLKEFPLS